jgi:hypothetical protein
VFKKDGGEKKILGKFAEWHDAHQDDVLKSVISNAFRQIEMSQFAKYLKFSVEARTIESVSRDLENSSRDYLGMTDAEDGKFIRALFQVKSLLGKHFQIAIHIQCFKKSDISFFYHYQSHSRVATKL